MKTLIISLFILILTGCSSNTNPVAGGQTDGRNEKALPLHVVYMTDDTYEINCNYWMLHEVYFVADTGGTLQIPIEEIQYFKVTLNK